jgi:pyridoxamine 5'-phosphate oxidase
MTIDLLDPLFDPRRISPDHLRELVWKTLDLASGQPDHPWRLPILGTVGDGKAHQRIVVLRGVDLSQQLLLAHTDLRSPKVAQLQTNTHASWLFYAPAPRVQLTLSGPVRIHTDDETANSEWKRLPIGPKRDYLSPLPPGALFPPPCVEESAPLERSASAPNRDPEISDGNDQGRENFAVLAGEVGVMDLLFIRPVEHLRFRMTRTNSGWQMDRLVP